MKLLSRGSTLGFMFILTLASGCMTWNAEIEDMSNVYSKSAIASAPKIIISDLSDKRSDTKLVGRISALNLATKTPVNIIITNRFASKLQEEGFNVQKVGIANPEDKAQIVEALKSNSGKVLFTGRLDHFYIESSDAILETAKGRVSFRIDMLDSSGNSLFYRTYTARAEKHIGLGGGPGSEELIKTTIQASVNELFKDAEFQQLLSQLKNK